MREDNIPRASGTESAQCGRGASLLKSSAKPASSRVPRGFFFYDFVKVTGALPVFLFFRYRTVFTDVSVRKALGGPLLIVSNHASYVDPVIVMRSLWRRRVVFMATRDLYRTRLGAWFFRHVHCIEVDKENVGLDTIKKVVSELKAGRAVAMFPEGSVEESKKTPLVDSQVNTKEHTASGGNAPKTTQDMFKGSGPGHETGGADFGSDSAKDAGVRAFKGGAAMIALKSGAAVLPVYIDKARRRVVVGSKIFPEAFFSSTEGGGAVSKPPTLRQIDEFSRVLHGKELELKDYSQSLG